MTVDRRKLGGRIRAARIAAGMSQAGLGRRAGMSKPTLSRYENDRVIPSIATLRRITSALGVTEAELLCAEGDSEQRFIQILRGMGVRITNHDDAERLALMVARFSRQTS